MKTKTLIAALAVACTVVLAGCASNGVKPLTPAQIASIACPQVNLVNAQLTALNTALLADPVTAHFGAQANATLIKLQPTVAAVCAAGATVTATNLQALAQQALPALATVVATVPMPAPQKAQIETALVVAQSAMGVVGVVESQIQAAKAVPAESASAQ